MINPYQLRGQVLEPVLFQLHAGGLPPPSLDATAILMGTYAAESTVKGDTCLVQLGGGPALGILQMEPATHDDHYKTWLLKRRPDAVDALVFLSGGRFLVQAGHSVYPMASVMIWNLSYAFAMARIHYFRVKERLPAHDDLEAQARYWKKHYNTQRGAGTVEGYAKAAKAIYSKWNKP